MRREEETVDHDFEDNEEEEELSRQSWFPFYVTNWMSSRTIRNMGADQEGWFINLLGESWLNSEIPGTLPNDDAELRRLAEYDRLTNDLLAHLSRDYEKWQQQTVDNAELSTNREPYGERGVNARSYESFLRASLEAFFERRWRFLMQKFPQVPGRQDLVHNPKLAKVGRKAEQIRRSRVRAARIAASVRLGRKGLTTSRSPYGQRHVNDSSTPRQRHVDHTDNHLGDDSFTITQPITNTMIKNNTTTPTVPSVANSKSAKSNKQTKINAQEIFVYWQTVMDHPTHQFTAKRRKAVEARLQNYTIEQIKRGIDGCRVTPHNMGDNETGQLWNDLELICRSPENLERFIDNYNRRDQIKARTNSNAKQTKDTYTRLAEKYQREADEEAAAIAAAAADTEAVPRSSEPAVRKNAALQLDAE